MAQNKVLFVDDETNIISALRRGVIDEPYLSLFAGSAAEALAIMEKQEISVIVTDMRMPGMDGLTLLKIVKDNYPRTVRVVLSGYTQLAQMLAIINQGEIFRFITKPWTTQEELLPTVRQALDYYNLQAERDTLRENLAKRNAAYQNILQTMERKLANEKSELIRRRHLSKWIFSLWRAHGGQTAEIAEGEIVNIVEAVYLAYLDQFPAVEEIMTAADLADELARDTGSRVTLGGTVGTAAKTAGNHRFLLFVLKTLADYAAPAGEKIAFDLSEGEPRQDGMSELAFSLKADETDIARPNRLALVCILLNKIGGFYNVSVTADRAGGRPEHIRVAWLAARA